MRSLQLTTISTCCFLLAGCSGKNEPVMSHGKPVAHWLEELKKSDPQARKKAVVALGHVGKADDAVIPALISVVTEDQNSAVRNEAILALLNIGTDAKDAVDALTQAQNDKDSTIRSNATKALERIRETR